MLWGANRWLWLLLIGSLLFFIGVNASAIVSGADAHPGLAAWVQAVGSILALGIAIWVPWYIHTREQTIAAMPRQRKLLMLKDALGKLRHALDHIFMLETEFPEDRIMAGELNLPVVSDQVQKGYGVYLFFEADLPRLVQLTANELFEATLDIEKLQGAMAAQRSMVVAERNNLRRHNNHPRVLAISLQKVSDAMRDIEPLLMRSIERLK